jgi:tripartite-type tricarboxylate transporter receptor subunit TctC
VALTALRGAAWADELDAIKGETFRVIIAANGGDTTDVEARLFLKYLQGLAPGATFRLQNDGNNSGATAMLELANASGRVPTLAFATYSTLFRPLLTPQSGSADLTKMKWIGSLTKVNRLLAMRKGMGGTTFETLRTLGRQPIAGANNATGASATEPLLLNAITGLRIKLLTGMAESERQALILAGKVDLRTGTMFELKPFFESGEMIPVMRFTKDDADHTYDAVPMITDVARPDAPKDLLYLMEVLYRDAGSMVAAAPATPPAMVEALQAARKRILADPGFIEAAAKAQMTLSTTDGPELGEMITRVLGPSSGIGELARAAIECGRRMSDQGAAGCN